jgi:AraC-like DNA-binding protein
MYYNELEKQNNILISQFVKNKELLISSLKTYTYNLVVDDIQFKKLLENYQGTNEDKIDITDKLKGFVNSNKFVNSAYLYIPTNNLVLTTDIDMSFNKEDFYDLTPINYSDKSYLKMLQQRKVKIAGKNYDYISIVCRVMSTNNNLIGIFVVNIKCNDVYKEAQNSIAISEEFNIYATDTEGKILYSNNSESINNLLYEDRLGVENLLNENKLNSKSNGNRLISNFYSSSEKINYQLSLEFKNYESKVILEYTLLSLVISICLGIVLKMIISQKVFKPLKRVISNISSSCNIEREVNSEIGVLETVFSDLTEKNIELQKQYTQMLPIYKEKLLRDIVERGDYTFEEIKNKLKYYEMKLDLNNYIIVTIRPIKGIYEEEKNPMIKILIRNKIEELMLGKYNGFCVETGKDDISVCLNVSKNSFDNTDFEDIIQFAEATIFQIKKELGINVNLGIGSFVVDIGEINKSYEESVEVLNYNKILRKAVVSIYEIKKLSKTKFEYPYDIETNLLNYIKIGDYKESCTYLDNIFYKVQNTSILTNLEIESIILLLLSALNELIYQNGIDIPDEGYSVEKMFQMIRNNSLDDVKAELKKYIIKIVDEINIIRGSSTSIINRVLQYLNENYAGELQLIDLEDKFKLNKYYIGQLIKENTGINFNDYLNKKRLEKAIELLKNTDFTIKDISEAVGYKYSYYFIKVFRKAYGMAPGEFRSKI